VCSDPGPLMAVHGSILQHFPMELMDTMVGNYISRRQAKDLPLSVGQQQLVYIFYLHNNGAFIFKIVTVEKQSLLVVR
jgi:hypothetical protein